MSAAPTVTGDRLGVVFGHSLATGAFADRGELAVVDGVEFLECGRFVALGRHGHRGFTPAHRIDTAGQMRALVGAGCDRLLALGSAGSLRVDWPVGTVAAPDDFLAPAVNPTFHDDGQGHQVPGFDADWRRTVVDAWAAAVDDRLVDGGTYAQTTGPRFETPAEIRFLAQHADLVGMTLAGEVVLAGEAGLRYAAVCSVDNLGNGLADEPLTVEEFRANKASNEDRMLRAVDALLDELLENTP